MERAARITSKASFQNSWNLERSMSSDILGPGILLHLSKVATLYYFWALMLWPARLMASSAIQFLQRPGTMPGSTILWWVKAASWQRLPAVGMFRLSSYQVKRQPVVRGLRFLVKMW